MSGRGVEVANASDRPPTEASAAWGAGVTWLHAAVVLISAGVGWSLWTGAPVLEALRSGRGPGALPLGLLIAPGIACSGVGVRAVWRARTIVQHGALRPVTVEFIARGPGSSRWLWVHYRYRDDRGGQHRARNRVRRDSPLAEAVMYRDRLCAAQLEPPDGPTQLLRGRAPGQA